MEPLCSDLEERVRAQAIGRVATVFAIDPAALDPAWEFGQELTCSFVSDFRFNEFDRLDQDIKDVADRETRCRLASGELVIRTVEDYCDHMVACFATNPDEVRRVLGLDR